MSTTATIIGFNGKTRSQFYKDLWASPEFRLKMIGRKGRLGKKHTEETKQKLSRYASERVNKQNSNWRGDKVKKSGLHQWIERKFGKAKLHVCEICKGTKGGKRMNWANVDGKYSRDISGWKPMCGVCHVAFDRKVFGAKIGRQKKLSL